MINYWIFIYLSKDIKFFTDQNSREFFMICLTLVLLKKKFTLSLLSLTIALSKQMKSKVEQTITSFFQLQHKLIMIIFKHYLDQINNSKQKKIDSFFNTRLSRSSLLSSNAWLVWKVIVTIIIETGHFAFQAEIFVSDSI